MNATTVAIDLAKSVFQLAVADEHWRIVETQLRGDVSHFKDARNFSGRFDVETTRAGPYACHPGERSQICEHMRLMEGMRLRIKDLDFDRHVIIVREAKGNKDRAVMLPLAGPSPSAADAGSTSNPGS